MQDRDKTKQCPPGDLRDCRSGKNYREKISRTETALEESQRRFQQLVESIPECIWETDTAGVYTYISPRVKDMFGFEPGEVIGTSRFDLLSPEDSERIRKVLQDSLSEQRAFHDLESICVCKDGRPVVISTSGKPFFTAEGELAGYRGVDRNITERKMAEEELWRSEQMFRDTFEQAAVGIAHIDLKGNFIRMNERYCDIVGYTAEDLLGMSFLDITHPSNRDAARESHKRLLAGEIGKYSTERHYVRKDGTSVWVNLAVTAISGGNNRTKYFMSVVEDITSRKEAERALQQSEAEYRAIFEAVTSFISSVDCNGTIVDCNHRSEDFLGYRKAELIGQSFSKIFHPEDLERARSALQEIFQKGCKYNHEYRMVRRDGAIIDVTINSHLLKGVDGQPDRTISFIEDITERKRAEEALRLTTFTINNATNAIYWMDSQGRIFQVNEMACRLLDYTRGELLAMTVHDIDPYFPPELWPVLWRDLKTRMSAVQETVHKTKDGKEIPVEVVANYLKYGDKEYVCAFARDITERIKAREEIAKTQALLEAAIEQTQAGIIVADAPDGRIRIANSAALGIRGKSARELTNIPIESHPQQWQTFYPDGTPFAPEELPLSRAILKGETTYNIDVIIKRADGEERWVLGNAAPVKNKKGDVVAGVVVFPDITELKRAEEERRLLETAIKQSAESIVITDAAGAIQYVNPAFEQSSGYRRDEVIGHNPSLLKSGKHDEAYYRRMWDKLSRGQEWSGRIVNRHKDGTLFEEEATISPVRDSSGQTTHYVAVKHDVTALAKLESQLRHAQKMEAIGTLTGGIAHDFNNILYAVLGYTQLAMDDVNENSRTYQNLAEVVRAGKRASDLVSQMLTFSRRVEQERRPLLLQPVIKEALKLIRGSAPTTITIHERLDQNCGAVLTDPTQIHQVILNLCTNSIHAMREQGGSLTVALTQVDVDAETRDFPAGLTTGKHALITVQDTGHGIEGLLLERIFEPYFTTKKLNEGTGLGLATVHGIIKSSDGAITAESRPGVSTTFKVYLPICEIPEPVDHIQDSEVEDLPVKGRVLFVDDEEMIVNMATLTLERIGCEVVAHTNSVAALEAFRADPSRFDLVITDQTMPKITGYELAREILNVSPDVPIILSTGYSENLDEEKAKDLGVREFLLKPVSIHKLVQIVRRVIGEKKQT